MPLSNIVVIVIRLFALQWLFNAIAIFVTAVGMSPRRGMATFVWDYGPGLVLTVLAVLFWFIASPVARFVSRGFDTNVNMGGLSRADLYSFAFVFLGLLFILRSFPDVVNWLHFFATEAEQRSYYEFARPCLTFAAGLVCLLGAPHWTRKVVARDEKNR